MPRLTTRRLAAAALAVGLLGCGRAEEQRAAPRSAPLLDRPITFTTEVQPRLDQEPVPATAGTAPAAPPTPAPASTGAPATVPTAPAAPPRSIGRTACRAVAHIGDSTSVGMTSAAVIPDARRRLDAQYARVGAASARIEASGGRSVVERLPGQQNGFEVAGRLRASGFSGCWVIALGTCDAANVAKGSRVTRAQRIERMMSVVGTDPVLWVDVVTRVADGVWADRHMQQWNSDLSATTARYPNARIYRATAQMKAAWFASDGIHYTSAGYSARAALTADALAVAFPG